MPGLPGAARGGSVRMFGVAVTPGHMERPASRRLPAWTQDYLRKAAVADLGCAVVGVSAAAQLLFGHEFRKRLHRRRAAGQCLLNVVAAGHELAVANLVTELHRDRYHRPALPDEAGKYARHVRPRPVIKAGPYRPMASQQAIRAFRGAGTARPAVVENWSFRPSTCQILDEPT